MRKRDRTRHPARRKSFKDSRPIILIVCEGSVTEPDYFNALSIACKNPRVRIKVVGGVGVPLSIVQAAKSQKTDAEERAASENNENLCYDEVWCVFDVDEHPNVSTAKQMAKDNGMQVAVSNPCFELWLWLYFAEQPGVQHRHDLQKMLNLHVIDYVKRVSLEVLTPGYPNAVRRAKKLDEVAEADRDGGRNPTTGVWRLTEAIQEIEEEKNSETSELELPKTENGFSC